MVWPIVIPQIDWNTFVKEMRGISGRAPTSILNAQREKVEGPSALLKAIAVVGDGTVDLDHASMGFLIHASYPTSVLMSLRTGLALSVSERLGESDDVAIVASGTVGQWKEAFLSLCTYDRPQEILEVFNDLYSYFEQASLTQFFKFRKTQTPSGLFTVEGGT